MNLLGVIAPHMLWLLLAIPVMLAAAQRRSRRAATLRVVAACGLVLVLAGAYVRRPRPAGGACVVLAVDVSASVQRAGLDAAARALPALASALGPNDLVAAVAFARGARVVAAPSAAPPTAAAIERAVDAAAIDRDASDLAAALRLAAPLCPDGTQAAVLLFSDGQETVGNVLAEAMLSEPPLPVFPVSLATAELPAGVIRRILAPGGTRPHPVPLEAVGKPSPAPVEATSS
jgi:hypothetical protein